MGGGGRLRDIWRRDKCNKGYLNRACMFRPARGQGEALAYRDGEMPTRDSISYPFTGRSFGMYSFIYMSA